MRLFVAVDLAEAAGDHLASALRAMPSRPHLRRSDPANWHITLAFLGEVEASTAEDLEPLLERIAQAAAPVELALSGSGAFSSALWIGVRGELSQLAAGVARAVRSAGVTLEKRPFHPHLTVARVLKGRSLRTEVDQLSSYSGPTWLADELLLVQSHLGRQVRHVPVGRWPLSG